MGSQAGPVLGEGESGSWAVDGSWGWEIKTIKSDKKKKKTSNLSPCPVPLVDKLSVKCRRRGERETDIYLARIWFGAER